MKIKLFQDAADIYVRRCYRGMRASCGMLHNPEYAKMLGKVEGQWLEVETDWLFANQFNTAPIAGVTTLGLRVMASEVEEVKDDVRPEMIRDLYTNKSYRTLADVPQECFTLDRRQYLLRWQPCAESRGIQMKERFVFKIVTK